MRHLGASPWVVVADGALASYLVALVVNNLWMTIASSESELSTLIRLGALYAGLILGVPTIALMVLLLVRRVARPAAVLAGAWMAFNAFLWLPAQPALAAWAAGVAWVVLAALVIGWRRDRVGSTRDRPPM